MNKQQRACTHQWLLDEATGPTSKGTCTLCGATKKFKNGFPGSAFIPEYDFVYVEELAGARF